MSGKVISFINMKGGVGKTTLCVGMGEYLANYLEKKILIIDLDPQFNATQTLMDQYDLTDEYMDSFRKEKNVRLIFEEPETIAERPKLPKMNEVIINLDNANNGRLDIICGTIDLIKDDDSRKAKYKRVKKFIKEQIPENCYDFIFIDCPPTISFFTDSAIYASDYYIVPTKIDRYSILGITLLNSVIEQEKFDDDLNISPLGIIYTNYPVNNKISSKEKDIIKVFKDTPVVKTIGIFEKKFYYNKDLMVGKAGNVGSNYKKSRENLEKICGEFLKNLKCGDKV